MQLVAGRIFLVAIILLQLHLLKYCFLYVSARILGFFTVLKMLRWEQTVQRLRTASAVLRQLAGVGALQSSGDAEPEVKAPIVTSGRHDGRRRLWRGAQYMWPVDHVTSAEPFDNLIEITDGSKEGIELVEELPIPLLRSLPLVVPLSVVCPSSDHLRHVSEGFAAIPSPYVVSKRFCRLESLPIPVLNLIATLLPLPSLWTMREVSRTCRRITLGIPLWCVWFTMGLKCEISFFFFFFCLAPENTLCRSFFGVELL
jgi:hypothetical protein